MLQLCIYWACIDSLRQQSLGSCEWTRVAVTCVATNSVCGCAPWTTSRQSSRRGSKDGLVGRIPRLHPLLM